MKRNRSYAVCSRLVLCLLTFVTAGRATTIFFNNASVGTSTFHGTNLDVGAYTWWQYNLGTAPVSVQNQTLYLTLFSPAGSDCSNPPAPGRVNILTFGPNEPAFGTYGVSVPPGFGFSLPNLVAVDTAAGGCYLTYAFDGANWYRPSWNQGDWVVVETGGTDLATDPTAAISAPYNNNAVDVSVRGAWACMTDDGNYAACLSLYHFAGFQPPINTDGSGVYKLGRTLPVKFQITDVNGDVVTTATASLVATVVQNGVVGPNPISIGTFNVAGDQYIYNLDTSQLAAGVWQIRVALNDGTSYSVLITLR